MRIFKTRGFSRFMRKEGITDDALRDAVARAERGLFLFGFAKSDQDNVDAGELKVLRKAAAEMLRWSEKQVAAMLASGAWTEVNDEREEVQE